MRSVAETSDGGLLAAGQVLGPVDFGGGTRGHERVASGFVVALAEDGSYRWDRAWTTTSEVFVTTLVVAPDGTLLLSGTFDGVTDLGAGARGRPGAKTGYVLALGSDGAYRWDQTWTTVGSASPVQSALVVAEDGTVLVAGTFRGAVDFSGEVQGGADGWNAYALAIGRDGSVRWRRVWTSSGQFVDLKRPPLLVDGTLVLRGIFQGTLDFGDGVQGHDETLSEFVLALSVDGEHRWDHTWRLDGQPEEVSPGIVAADGTLRFAGAFRGTADLGGGTRGEPGATTGYVLALGPDGTYRWDRAWTTDGDVRVSPPAALPSGETVVSGRLRGVTDFGSGPRGEAFLESLFVVAVGPDGAYRWDRLWPGGPDFTLSAPVVSPSGSLLFTGTSRGGVDPDTQVGPGRPAAFVRAMSPDGASVWERGWFASGGITIEAPGAQGDRVWVTGEIEGVADFGGGARGREGTASQYLVVLDGGGAYRWDQTWPRLAAMHVLGTGDTLRVAGWQRELGRSSGTGRAFVAELGCP